MPASALAWRVPNSARLNSAKNKQCVKKTKSESQHSCRMEKVVKVPISRRIGNLHAEWKKLSLLS